MQSKGGAGNQKCPGDEQVLRNVSLDEGGNQTTGPTFL